MTALGPQGLREAGELCCHKAHYAAEKLTAVDGFSLAFDRPFFKEFAVRCPAPAGQVIEKTAAAGLGIGPDLSRFSSDLDAESEDLLLIAVTEQRTRDEIDRLAEVLAS
jgi:glycine dehydrogenase subunit 1